MGPDRLLTVLFDADNVSPSRIPAVMSEVARFGTASVRRVYGDWTKPNLRTWKSVARDHVIQPIQQFDNTVGKNATDSALIIDAMDLLHTRRFAGFCIISSDGDFTRLASRIREDGVAVYGFGERTTPESFRNACDRFTYLDVIVAPEPGETPSIVSGSVSVSTARVQPERLRGDGRLVSALRAAVGNAADEAGWAELSAVGNLMRSQQPDFDARNWGYAKLSDLIAALGLFVLEPKPKGGIRVRATAAKRSGSAPATSGE